MGRPVTWNGISLFAARARIGLTTSAWALARRRDSLFTRELYADSPRVHARTRLRPLSRLANLVLPMNGDYGALIRGRLGWSEFVDLNELPSVQYYCSDSVVVLLK